MGRRQSLAVVSRGIAGQNTLWVVGVGNSKEQQLPLDGPITGFDWYIHQPTSYLRHPLVRRARGVEGGTGASRRSAETGLSRPSLARSDEVVLRLEVQPELRWQAERVFELDRGIGDDRTLASDDLADQSRRSPHSGGEFPLGEGGAYNSSASVSPGWIARSDSTTFAMSAMVIHHLVDSHAGLAEHRQDEPHVPVRRTACCRVRSPVSGCRFAALRSNNVRTFGRARIWLILRTYRGSTTGHQARIASALRS